MSLLGDHRSLVDFMDRLLQELDSVRPNRSHSNPPPPPPPLTTTTETTTTSDRQPPAGSSKPSAKPPPPPPPTTMPASAIHHPSTDAGVKVRPKPAVPPKPPLDSIRFSMATVEDSPETDLDALLGELFALESQLNSAASDSLLLGMPALPTSATRQPAATSNRYAAPASSATALGPFSAASAANTGVYAPPMMQAVRRPVEPPTVETPTTPIGQQPTSVHLPLTNGASRLAAQATDHSTVAAHSAHLVQQQQQHQARHQPHHEHGSLGVRTGSPDADSAFGDGASMLSNESSTHRSRDSNVSSADSSRGSLNTPSPTQQNVDSSPNAVTLLPVQESEPSKNEPSEESRRKADKIKQALEKMKEANIKKLYVKFFTSDGGSKSLLVDERSTVSHVLRQLAEKHRNNLNTNYAVVEQYPDLFMERIYEDQEHLVENILMWTRDSSNKLFFIERQDKYAFIDAPQDYLVGDTTTERHAKLDESRKQQILEEFFAPAHVQPPEVEGWLYLKADGKKAWKRHYFVLRPSGLYYTPKGKSKSSKDLVCLMNLEMNQIYNSIGWRRKYKAPTDFGFAIKHPQIQVKASKYIKYLCAEDEASFRRWMVALRIAKNNRQLYDNYEAMKTYLDSDEAKSATDSMRSSASAENCSNGDAASLYSRDSVVIRPRSIVSNNSDSEVKMRPKSADINGRVGAQKRNSGLLRVDLPTIPDSECVTSSDQPPAVSQPPHLMSASALYARGSGSQTPTSQYSGDGQQLVFEQSDMMTGTIKRQPLDHNRSPNLLATNGHHQRRQSTEGGASVSSGKDPSGGDLDSDEELFPPPPPPISAVVATVEDDSNGLPPPFTASTCIDSGSGCKYFFQLYKLFLLARR
uniref:Uncharacterized protein n=1 Tax=Plectus sambesii TaxID=2011161 RepID=A0A914XQD2_9BILA